MPTTVGELREVADRHLYAGDYERALHAYGAIVQVQPTDLDPRIRVADCLLALGELQLAATVYAALARHAANAGYPLRALIALKTLEQLDPQLGALLAQVAALYATGSERLGRSVRFSLGDATTALPPIDLSQPPARPELVKVAAALASDFGALARYPEKLPPIPLFSQLPASAFAGTLAAMKLRRCRPGQAVIQEGEVGQSFFVIARGTVRVSRIGSSGEEIELAKLHDGSIFGEMALVSALPRAATVATLTDADLLEFDREALQAVADHVSTLATALEKFMRERLLNNLLATSPLFRPLDRKQRLDLIRRFTAHDVAAGTPIIREGEVGRGLYALLHGQADVWKRDGDQKVLLATLGPGEVFGEISLLHDERTTANVTAATNCTLLFLGRELFQRLVDAFDSIREYVEELGEERLMDTELTLSSPPVDVREDDLVLI